MSKLFSQTCSVSEFYYKTGINNITLVLCYIK